MEDYKQDFKQELKEKLPPKPILQSQAQQSTKSKTTDNIIRISQERKKLDEKWQDGFLMFFKIAPLLLINVIGLAIIGLDNFVQGTWSWRVFQNPNFWYSYGSFQTANWLIAIAWLINVLKKMSSNHIKYIENCDIIQNYVDLDHDKPFITKQCSIETLRRKKEALELKIGDKLYKLANKHRIKSIDEFLVKGKGKEFKGKEKRLYGKISRYNDMLTPQWQKSYLKSYTGSLFGIKVFKLKYPKITRTLIVSGVSPSKKNGIYNSYKPKTFSVSFKKVTPNLFLLSAIGVFLLSFQFVLQEPDQTTILKFFIQVILIVWNTFTLLSLSGTIFIESYLRSTEERRSDLGMMLAREESKNEDTKDILEIMNTNDNLIDKLK